MEENLKYPIGIQHFPDIIKGGYLYADKTGYVKMLVSGKKYFFLSRPRRFGKSLLISTLQSYFEGRRELFKGLDIDTDDVEWISRPVIKLSLNTIDAKSEDALYQTLDATLAYYEDLFGVSSSVKTPAERFQNLIRTAFEHSGKKVAILVDEYDTPLLNTIDNESLHNSYRDTLRAVFSVLKNADEYIHFALVTGVSRFSHTSLFSGANNLEDISLDDRYAAICGITEDELRTKFMPGINEFAKSESISNEEMIALLKENYDGYHFSQKCPDIYNPFSLLNALDKKKIDNYWFASGTPDALLRSFKQDNFRLPNLDCIETLGSNLSARESYMRNPITLMYEAGYLTIKDYDDDTAIYTLGLPNAEVSTSFSEALLPLYSGMDKMDFNDSFIQIRKAVLKGEPENFMRHLQTFLEGNPYGLSELKKREKYFQTNLYLIFKALGFRPQAEEQTCRARMDLMLRTRKFIYIFELKTNGSAEEAMNQIDAKGYASPYADEGLKIIKIAANYSSSANNIDSWEICIV